MTTSSSTTTDQKPVYNLVNRKHSLPVRPRDPVHLYSSLVAGFGSGALASVLCAPIDLIRTRLQVWGDIKGRQGAVTMIPSMLRQIVAQEGWRGCFRGLGATLVTVPAFWGVYFPLYNDLKRYGASTFPQYSTTWIHLGSAVAAGTVSDVLCNPLFVVRTRIQTDFLHSGGQPKGVVETAKSLLAESNGNIFIFWRGMMANLMGLSHVAVQFPVYEKLKKELKGTKRHESPLDLLLASFASKMIACILTYPHEVIRSRMMDSRTTTGFLQTCRHILEAEGWSGFYAGLPVSLIRVIPNCCITFMTYEIFCRWSKETIDEYLLARSSSEQEQI